MALNKTASRDTKPGPERRERRFKKIEQTIPVTFDEIGDVYEGIYSGKKQVPFTEKGRGTRLNWLYAITPEGGGTPQGVWGSQYLDSMMDQVGIGQYVRITFVDEKPAKSEDQNPMRVYQVEVEAA